MINLMYKAEFNWNVAKYFLLLLNTTMVVTGSESGSCQADYWEVASKVSSSLGRAKNSRYQCYFLTYKISIISFYTGTTMFL